jgi:hypothetical protein
VGEKDRRGTNGRVWRERGNNRGGLGSYRCARERGKAFMETFSLIARGKPHRTGSVDDESFYMEPAWNRTKKIADAGVCDPLLIGFLVHASSTGPGHKMRQSPILMISSAK